VGENSYIEDAVIRNSVLESDVDVRRTILEESILGKQVQVHGRISHLNLGDNSSTTS
jgi:ADP-glucose pyrophosphorylase